MIAVTTIAVTCDKCGKHKPAKAFHRFYYPDRDGRYVQPCKDCMKAAREASPPPAAIDLDLQEVAATMAALVAYALDLGKQALPDHSAVQLLVDALDCLQDPVQLLADADALDCLEDPEEISQAGRNPLASPEGPVGGG